MMELFYGNGYRLLAVKYFRKNNPDVWPMFNRVLSMSLRFLYQYSKKQDTLFCTTSKPINQYWLHNRLTNIDFLAPNVH